jgi:hypothetical protein
MELARGPDAPPGRVRGGIFCEVAPDATDAYDRRRGTLPPNWLGRLAPDEPEPSAMTVLAEDRSLYERRRGYFAETDV